MADSGSTVALPRRGSFPSELATLALGRAPAAAAWLYGALAVGLIASSSGGFLPTSWDWTSLVTLWLAAMTLLLVDTVAFGRLEACFAGGLALFTAWVAASNLWTASVTSTMLEAQRDLAYFGLVVAGFVVIRRQTVPHLLGGVLTAVTAVSVYGLATRLLPDRIGTFDSTSWGYRLSPPITYWNGLGIFAAMGILLALSFATRGERLATRAAAAGALPALSLTMYFTFSRGAWAALAIGLAFAVVADPRRLQLIAVGGLLAICPALAIHLASAKHGLTSIGASLQQATSDGHALVTPLLLLAAASAAVALGAGLIERRVTIPTQARRAFALLVVAAVMAGGAAVWAKEGSPWHLASRAWGQFQGVPKQTGTDLSQRLFQLSSNGRVALWKVSLKSFDHSPLLGHGAGTFAQLWAKDPTWTFATIQPHSLYFGTLAELGLPGLLLLALALLAPFAAGLRLRASPLVPLTLGAYAAWLAHTGVDWDWELTGVSAVPLLCGVALLRGRDTRPRRLPPRWRAASVTLLGVLVLGVVLVLDAEHNLALAAQHVQTAPASAVSEARVARRWEPWASEPYQLEAEAYVQQGRRRAALEAIKAAVSRDPSSWQLWRGLAAYASGPAARHARARSRSLYPALYR